MKRESIEMLEFRISDYEYKIKSVRTAIQENYAQVDRNLERIKDYETALNSLKEDLHYLKNQILYKE